MRVGAGARWALASGLRVCAKFKWWSLWKGFKFDIGTRI